MTQYSRSKVLAIEHVIIKNKAKITAKLAITATAIWLGGSLV